MNPADVREALTFATCWTALKVNRAQAQKSIYDGSQGSEARASQVPGAHVGHFSWLLSSDIGFFLIEKAGPGSVGWVKLYLDVLGWENPSLERKLSVIYMNSETS